jgi:uncharacterized protein (DUF1778 family)
MYGVLPYTTALGDPVTNYSRRVEFRASEDDYDLIQQVAAETGLSVSDYVRSRTVDDARRELAERRTVQIGPEHAEAFYAALDDDTPVPELQRLADVAEPDLS